MGTELWIQEELRAVCAPGMFWGSAICPRSRGGEKLVTGRANSQSHLVLLRLSQSPLWVAYLFHLYIYSNIWCVATIIIKKNPITIKEKEQNNKNGSAEFNTPTFLPFFFSMWFSILLPSATSSPVIFSSQDTSCLMLHWKEGGVWFWLPWLMMPLLNIELIGLYTEYVTNKLWFIWWTILNK